MQMNLMVRKWTGQRMILILTQILMMNILKSRLRLKMRKSPIITRRPRKLSRTWMKKEKR